ncbi:MAG: HD domain-containing protein [Spirochaetales bacterium]|nr:HD domain-containing protein [Spirochaetales bacterium]
MHDVGKIGTPDNILTKPGPLTKEEWIIMKEHPKSGALILSAYPDPMAAHIANFHHEKWDGKGYPYGFSEQLIPLAARIVAIADVYDALRMKRSYKDPFSHSKTMEIIREDAGSHFDPDLIDIFLKYNKEFDSIFENLRDS